MQYGSLAIAGTNPAKAAMLKRVAAPLGIACAARVAVDFDESGATFADNACAKALAASGILPRALAIASDGGLEIPSLGARWDPVRTSRFAGQVSPDVKARRLLDLAGDLRGSDREARWVESLAIASEKCIIAVWSEHGVRSSLAMTVPHAVGAFWVDVLLLPIEEAPTHWERLALRFARWWQRERFARDRAAAWAGKG